MQTFFQGKKILISAGATYENIDPVRFIGNRSSGKMGIEIANAFAKKGANVFLIKANTDPLIKIFPLVKVIPVSNTDQLHQACFQLYHKMNIVIMAAAVADFKPITIAQQKIKKNTTTLTLKLTKTHDILKQMGQEKTSQLLVGFALETTNPQHHAQQKLIQKNCDIIILNTFDSNNPVFGSNNNQVHIFSQKKPPLKTPQLTKKKIAHIIQKYIFHYLK